MNIVIHLLEINSAQNTKSLPHIGNDFMSSSKSLALWHQNSTFHIFFCFYKFSTFLPWDRILPKIPTRSTPSNPKAPLWNRSRKKNKLNQCTCTYMCEIKCISSYMCKNPCAYIIIIHKFSNKSLVKRVPYLDMHRFPKLSQWQKRKQSMVEWYVIIIITTTHPPKRE